MSMVFNAEYQGLPREVLLRRTTDSLVARGYVEVGQAFDGTVLGYAKGPAQLAVKVDQVGERLFLAVFDEEGKEPLLHGVVFGKYLAEEEKHGSEAIER